jgi:hypothetical protein
LGSYEKKRDDNWYHKEEYTGRRPIPIKTDPKPDEYRPNRNEPHQFVANSDFHDVLCNGLVFPTDKPIGLSLRLNGEVKKKSLLHDEE